LLYKKVLRDDLYWRLRPTRRKLAELDSRIKDEGPYHHIDKPSKCNYTFLYRKRHETWEFRLRRFNCIQESIRRDIEKEYGITV
jgi:hypothetical protein